MHAQLGGWIFAEALMGIAMFSFTMSLMGAGINFLFSIGTQNEDRSSPYVNVFQWKGYGKFSDCVKSHLGTWAGMFLICNLVMISGLALITMLSTSIFWVFTVPAIYIGVTIYLYKKRLVMFWPMNHVFNDFDYCVENGALKCKEIKEYCVSTFHFYLKAFYAYIKNLDVNSDGNSQTESATEATKEDS